jgi:hypothetical protein
MLGQLRFAAELGNRGAGGLPAILRPLHDPLTLILSERAQKRGAPPAPACPSYAREESFKAPFKSISSHLAPLLSPDLVAVRTSHSKASLVAGSEPDALNI